MDLFDELEQIVEYDKDKISILELFIKDSKYYYSYFHLYKINQVTRLFLISHEADLVFTYYSTPDSIQKAEKINNIIENFNFSYNLLVSIGFSFQNILKYTYYEFYDISSIIDAIQHKKYLWRRIIKKHSIKILLDSNDQIIYFINEKNTYTFRHNFVSISIPACLFQYVDGYIEQSHRITHKKIIISGMLYNEDRTEYINQQQKYEEWKSEREKRIRFTKEIRAKQETKLQNVTEKTKTILMFNNNNNSANRKDFPQVTKKQEHELSYNDFIIRCAIFKCSFKQHKIIDIDASIDIINISTNYIVSMIIPAGYCSNCNKYFIMDSTYQKIFTKGLPLCKIIDERAYKASSISTSNKWGAQESILKQYGYSVSAIENLSETKRQKTLAVILDINALTKVEIIGYLKYFIRIHQSDSRFEKAISKWRDDIDFVSEYNKGHYTTYKVSGLKKNW